MEQTAIIVNDDMKELINKLCDVFKDKPKEKEYLSKAILKKYYNLSYTEYKDIKKLDEILETFSIPTSKDHKKISMKKYYQNNKQDFKDRNTKMLNEYKQLKQEKLEREKQLIN